MNQVDTDAVVSRRRHPLLPSDYLFPPHYFSTTETAQRAIVRVSDFLLSPAGEPNPPRVVELDQIADAPYMAASALELRDFIQDPAIRVVTASPAALTAVRNSRIETRRDYDLSRFVLWSRDRLDTSFVKLSVSHARTDGAGQSGPGSLVEVMADGRSSELLVLRGAAGAGKSVQLRFLETSLVLDSLRNGSDGSRPLPFRVSLGEHAATGGDSEPMAWLERQWARRVDADRMNPLRGHLATGQTYLILDGFNEIAFGGSEDRRKWMHKWRECIHEDLLRSPSNRVVVACRTRDLSISMGTSEVAATYVDLTPLTEREVYQIAAKRNPEAADQLKIAFEDDPSLIELYNRPFPLSDYLEYIEGPAPRSQSEIFLRRISSALEREKDRMNYQLLDKPWLPEAPVKRLINAETMSEKLSLFPAVPLLRSLGRLATHMIAAIPGVDRHRTTMTMQSSQSALLEAPALADQKAAEEILYGAAELDLLHVTDLVSFQHQTLQDFFAAVELDDQAILQSIDLSDDGYSRRLGSLDQILADMATGDELPLVPATGYEDVFSRAVEMRSDLITSAITKNPWLVAERLRTLPLAETDRRAAVARTIDELGRRRAESTDPRVRLASVANMARLGWSPSPCRGQGTFDHLLPTVHVPQGRWQVGCGPDTRKRVGSSRASSTVELDAFAVGAYPVTNRDFREFIDDGGYGEARHWSADGWLWRSGELPIDEVLTRWTKRRDSVHGRPRLATDLLTSGMVSVYEAAAIVRFGRMSDDDLRRAIIDIVGKVVGASAFFDDRRFAGPLDPVVGVCWHEAMAYCSWLSAQTGRTVRLLTEDEWEAAAIYSHSAEPSSIDDIPLDAIWTEPHGNTAELHVERTTPVGGFWDGMSPRRGAHDMSGNVFEWVTDAFNPQEEWSRVVKGGSWRHLLRRAHPGYRGRGDTTTRNDDNGFRIAMSE